ncbi:SEL1-like repeat protein [Legionella spiritensis]|uniref:Sel1 repeat protein n=1 Tax=Legionella spiritensis TaxID=452 RepID=A0A0W0Z4G9_LEGSP|nr:hypothetical protein [Legionella spiritensis]KTD64036.1 hypothetical protein Lspi_1555 [Legionella spiritensis]SNV37334.1 Uncharacterised protein [Legionella spiritensis]
MNQDNSDKQPSCCGGSCSATDVFCYARDCADCNKDDAQAALASGLVYAGVLYPELQHQDQEKAIYYLRQSIEAGDNQAVKMLVNAYLTGKMAGCCCSIKADYNKWLALCDELAELGHQDVAYSAALWFAGIEKPGDAVDSDIKSCFKRDADQAIHYLRLCSRGDDPEYAISALDILCSLLITGNDTIMPDSARLKNILKDEVAKGNQYAQEYLSRYFQAE